MYVTVKCENDGAELTVDGEYSRVRANITNFLIDHNHTISEGNT